MCVAGCGVPSVAATGAEGSAIVIELAIEDWWDWYGSRDRGAAVAMTCATAGRFKASKHWAGSKNQSTRWGTPKVKVWAIHTPDRFKV